jgi:hypothetical protein
MQPHRSDVPDEPPPFLGTWPRVYIATVCYLIVLLLVFSVFTRTFQ